MSTEKKEEKELRVLLESEMFDKIEKIKDYYGLKSLTESVRFMITKIERHIKKKIKDLPQ